MSSCLEEIFLFQKKLNKYAKFNEVDKVLYYLHKLNHLNVTVSHLEETGVGKTVNALRHQGGKVGEKARGLVNKWKAMVTAEEEEEEEETGDNEEELQTREELTARSRDEKEQPDYQEEDEEEDEDEENCLQIEENNNPVVNDYIDEGSDHGSDEELQPAMSVPPPAYSYSQRGNSGSEGEDTEDYNPLTSRSDYQAHTAKSVAEYHPSTVFHTPRDTSSPEWDGNSPEAARDWKNGTSARSPGKKGSREEKGHSQEREKHQSKGKGKHRDSSSSHERERKRDKHRSKHRKRDEKKEEAEEEKRSKSHKDKHRDREKHHGKTRESKHRGEESEQSKYERGSEASVVNGFNTPEHKDKGSSSSKRGSERSVEERQRERVVGEEYYQSGEGTIRVAERTKTEKEKHREGSSRKEEHKKEREKGESPDRQKKEKKGKHHSHDDEGSSASSNSVNKDSRGGERTSKEGKGKHKESKHKHEDSSKDKHKKNSQSRNDMEERESRGEKNKKEKKSKHQSSSSIDSGFGAVLIGLDSQVKKKKKKKKKEVRDSCSEEDQPSTSSAYKRGPADSGGLPNAKKPKLLSASVDKLPKLPPVVVADEKPLLPEITPNYKPLPRVPVKEEGPESCLSKMTEEEALNLVFRSKSNRRSKVYSGKVCGLSYVPSLYEACIRVLQENIDALEYTGGIPFDILRPVLERATPKQLLNLEDFNHNLLDDSDVLWEVHCKRDFKKMKPEEMETWRELWIRCSEERDRRLKNLTHNLTEKFLTKAEPKRTTKMAYVDTAAKVPKSVARAQAKYGTATASALAAKPGKGNEVAARKTALQNVQRAERAGNARPVAAKKKKVAPLMAKTKQFFKKTFRR